MTHGIIIISHDLEDLSYTKMAVFSARLAKKNLKCPVSLITDSFTLSKLTDIEKEEFDKIIISELSESDANERKLNIKGKESKVPFKNSDRSKVFDLTPYDTTLLIDSDFLIQSDVLNQFWEIDQSVMMAPGIVTSSNDGGAEFDMMVSPETINLYWATTVMFKKNNESKIFFDLVKYVKENYKYYSDFYRFSNRQYRNDISFSIAYHMWCGFFESNSYYSLPKLFTLLPRDEIYKIEDNGLTAFIWNNVEQKYLKMIKVNNRDVHFMNKVDLVEKLGEI
jgi:hypothetical protein